MSCYVDDGQRIPLGEKPELIFERVVGNRSVAIENTGVGGVRIGSENVDAATGFGLPPGGRLTLTVPDIPDKLYAVAQDPELVADVDELENSVLVTSIVSKDDTAVEPVVVAPLHSVVEAVEGAD